VNLSDKNKKEVIPEIPPSFREISLMSLNFSVSLKSTYPNEHLGLLGKLGLFLLKQMKLQENGSNDKN